MNGEIRPVLAVLPGAIEGVNNPDAIGMQSVKIINALLGQDRVQGTSVLEPPEDEQVSLTVPGKPKRLQPLAIIGLNMTLVIGVFT